jgi:zinc transport system substrate-binding protein
MKQSKFIIIAVLAISIILGLVFFATNSTQAPRAIPQQLKVVATIFPIYDIAKNIAGDKAKVVNILPPGASPHTFEPKPSDILALQDASLIFVIGHGLDDWIVGLANSSLSNARTPLPRHLYPQIQTIQSTILEIQNSILYN